MTYLELLEKANVTPNFWCSEEYFKKAELECVTSAGQDGIFEGIFDKEWGQMFPLLNSPSGNFTNPSEKISFGRVWKTEKIWSDFPEWKPSNEWKPKFLDYEYIYDPEAFLHMDGGKWQVFRKNCRKWPRRFGNGYLRYDWINSLLSPFQRDELSDVLTSWLENKPSDDKIMDDEVLVEYLFHGKNRKILYHRNKIYGVNIWDENYKYINYRFAICRPEEFLSEYMRWLFYTDPFIQSKNKFVNDGGVLDNPNLKKFKDKMNPLRIREVCSWTRKEGIDVGKT